MTGDGEPPTGDDWEQLAAWWVETFTEGADDEYERQIIPLVLAELVGAGSVLDLGCGEGQIARRLASAGSRVVGMDPTRALLEEARGRAAGPTYVQASGSAIPVSSEPFDAVLVSLVLEHTPSLASTVSEIARVLRPGGRLVLVLNHPLLQSPGSGWIEDHVLDPPDSYWRVGPYLEDIEFEEQFDAERRVRFIHRPLHRYVNAFAARGLFVTNMIEPAPVEIAESDLPRPVPADIPRMMVLRLEKLGA